jgi:hypothetical protein
VNKATFERNALKCCRPLGAEAEKSDNFFLIFEELTINFAPL